MIRKALKPLTLRYLRYKQFNAFKKALKSTKDNIRVVVGSSGIYTEGWIPSEYHFLNLLKEEDWYKYFKENSINIIIGEHVWVHLTPEEGYKAASVCYKFLKKGGRLRIAIPDGNHPDEAYINHVKPGGVGPGADDHKVLYTYKTLSAMLEKAGFKVSLLEYFDDNKVFQQNSWNSDEGHVRRSFKHDIRNKEGKPVYTSLIADAFKL